MSSTEQELLALQETLYSSSNPTRRWLHTQRRDWVEACLREQAEQFTEQSGHRPKAALEIGPGSGLYLTLLGELAESVTAADIEDAYLEHAREVCEHVPNLHVQRDDITNSQLPAGQYDLILCSEVLEHVADSVALLRGIKRLLSPNGRLILSTPQRYSPLEQCAKIAFLPVIIDVVRLIYREPILPTGHINLLTEPELREQLRGASLQADSCYKCGFYLPLLAELGGKSAQRLLSRLEAASRGTMFDGLLWTQCYIVRAGEDAREQ